MARTISERPLAAAFEAFRRQVIPKDAPPIQVVEMQKAFMAGASVLFTLLIKGVSEGDEVNQADMNLMAAVQAEVDTFGQELDRACGISPTPENMQ